MSFPHERAAADLRGPLLSTDHVERAPGGDKHVLQRRATLAPALKRAYEAVPVALVILDAAGRIEVANAACLSMLGWNGGSVEGLKFENLPTMGAQSGFFSLIERRRADEGARIEVNLQRADGSRLPVLLSVGTLPLAEDEAAKFLVTLTDVSSLKTEQRKLERLAHYDPLTSLPNRTLFAGRLRRAMARARRTRSRLGVCYLDLDGFKPVNDRYGHRVGDALLAEIARRIQSCLGPMDTAGRIGGDEFALLLSHVGSNAQIEVRLTELLGRLARPARVENQDLRVSASIGVSFFPDDDVDADTLLRHADEAMYQAKREGRNRYWLFDAELERAAADRQRMRLEFTEAMARGELRVYYQPKLALRTGRIVGAEALVRWQHPERGLLMPGQFLPALEDTDSMIALGDWVATQVEGQVRSWRASGLDLALSLNVDVRELEQSDFAERMAARFGDLLHLWPGAVELEILESAALRDIDNVAATMQRCQAFGLGFALDDFGTGYSSLSCLRHLPANTVKIDRSFVADILNRSEDRALVGGVVGIATSLGHRIVAEGVESLAHGRALRILGCEIAQGFGISPALPPEQLPRWIQRFHADGRWVF